MNNKSTIQARYDTAHTTQFKMKLHNYNDADILEWLEKQDSKQGSIKRLIREEIEQNK